MASYVVLSSKIVIIGYMTVINRMRTRQRQHSGLCCILHARVQIAHSIYNHMQFPEALGNLIKVEKCHQCLYNHATSRTARLCNHSTTDMCVYIFSYVFIETICNDKLILEVFTFLLSSKKRWIFFIVSFD